MVESVHVETLVVGSGFAGTVIAKQLRAAGRQVLICERGEKVDPFKLRAAYEAGTKTRSHSSDVRSHYQSRVPWNKPDSFRPKCRSEYILVAGGCSNHWGGLTFRLHESVFKPTGGEVGWPIDYESMLPYYDKAERELHICADPRDPDKRVEAPPILASNRWKDVIDRYFPSAYFGAQSHNLGWKDATTQGRCVGSGDCELCPADAKTRADHFSAELPIRYETVVDAIVFEGSRAVAVQCRTEQGPIEVSFDQVVIAAHGVESCKLLWRSNLPEQVRTDKIGARYQDHAVAELAATLDVEIPYLQTNTATQLIIPELSGSSGGINYTTLGLVGAPGDYVRSRALRLDLVNQWQFDQAAKEFRRILEFFILLEVPPSWNVRFEKGEGGAAALRSEPFFANCAKYDVIIAEIKARLRSMGAKPIDEADRLHYKTWFGTHHLVGTLAMRDDEEAVVSPDFRVIGTDNVYVAGASIIPRCGSRNPTLTVVALAHKLAEQLLAN